MTRVKVKTTQKKYPDYHLIRIYLNSSYFLAHIFDDQEKMISYLKERHPEDNYTKTVACFIPIWSWKNRKRTGEIGEIYFSAENFNPYTIHHECTHAVLTYFKRFINHNKNTPCNATDCTKIYGKDEELFCGLIADLAKPLMHAIPQKGVTLCI